MIEYCFYYEAPLLFLDMKQEDAEDGEISPYSDCGHYDPDVGCSLCPYYDAGVI